MTQSFVSRALEDIRRMIPPEVYGAWAALWGILLAWDPPGVVYLAAFSIAFFVTPGYVYLAVSRRGDQTISYPDLSYQIITAMGALVVWAYYLASLSFTPGSPGPITAVPFSQGLATLALVSYPIVVPVIPLYAVAILIIGSGLGTFLRRGRRGGVSPPSE